MSLWEFEACCLGVSRANGAKVEDHLHPQAVEEMAAFLDQPPIWERA